MDPGREYFFDLGSFRRNEFGLGLRYDTAGPFDIVLGAGIADERVDSGTGYFDNVRQNASLGVRYEVGLSSHVSLTYGLERVPPPATRPVAEMRSQALLVGVLGQLRPSLRANVSGGYRLQENPRAAAGADRFSGITFAGSLAQDLPKSGLLTLSAQRSTQLSAFENNAFYVVDGVQLTLRMPVVLSFEVNAGTSYQDNTYRLTAQGLAEPRHDRLVGWTAGLARPVTRWAYLRADYNWERRNSNVPGLSAKTHAFIAQLGLGVGVKR